MATQSVADPCTFKVAFLVYLLLEGLQRSMGIFFFSTRHFLECSRKSAALPFVLSRAISILTDAFFQIIITHRKSEVWIRYGCFLCAVGVALCFLAKNIVWYSAFWGIFVGIGTGVASPTLLTILTKQKYRSTYTAAVSLGCIILPFFIKFLVTSYGQNGSYLLLSGTILNCIPVLLIASYGIEFSSIPKIWQIRKRSKRYEIQEYQSNYSPQGVREFYNKSFMENLEPDKLQKVNEKDETTVADSNSELIDILQPIIDAKLKMTNAISEKTIFHGAENEIENKDNNSISVPKTNVEIHLHQKERPSSVLENSIQPNFNLFNVSNIECIPNLKPEEVLTSAKRNADNLKDPQVTQRNPTIKESENFPTIPSDNRTYEINKEITKPTENTPRNFPLEIKVRVVECTITTCETIPEVDNDNNQLQVNTNCYRRHSNSLITACYDSIDLEKLLNTKSSSFNKQWNASSRICLISEDEVLESNGHAAVSDHHSAVAALACPRTPAKGRIEQMLQSLMKPSCLAIIYASVIYEFSLTLLLLIYSDFAEDTHNKSTFPEMMLVAFGIGGFVGQLSFRKWGSRFLVDGAHAAAAVIFLLNGLAVAGILWSTKCGWLSGFYAMLGFVENGIVLTLPKLTMDYIDQKADKILSITCKGLSGIAVLCIPFAIGLSRDVGSSYDPLLQVTSCLFVLCAVLCYFLPRLNGEE